MITIGELQLYIGKKSDYRAPFWNCVKAVNHARPRLRLIWRLDRLVARACRLPPSPLEKLEEIEQQKQLKAHESGFVDEIKKAIGTYSDDPVPADMVRRAPILKPYSDDPAPADVVRWAPVLKRVNSHQHETKVKALGQNTSFIMGYPEVKDFVAFASWLDFAYQFMKWRERVWPALSSFLAVVVQLENEDYFMQVFSGPVPNAQSMKKEMARGRALWRQRKRRLRQKTKIAEIRQKTSPKTVTKS